MKLFLLAVASILISVAAQFSLKAGMSSSVIQRALASDIGPRAVLTILAHPGVVLGFVLYGLGALLWLGVLARWDVSKAYPLVGLGFIVAVLVGWLHGEQVSVMRTVGTLLICSGVVLVGRS